jgi:hypothetical protein
VQAHKIDKKKIKNSFFSIWFDNENDIENCFEIVRFYKGSK